MKKIFFLIIFARSICFGQERFNLESLIPPAPNASELGKYGTYPVGTLTGIPGIGFPLYEVKSGSLTLPISLSYHASGVQVNQKATDVGLGWSIMAGGQISRTVYGAKDEGTYGYFNYNPPSFETLFNLKNYYTMATYNIVSNTGYDLEPDLFVYNIGGKSGKFIFTRNKSFVTIPFDPIKIQKSGTSNVSFEITDDNGTIYKFGKFSTTISDFSIHRNTPSTWYLTSITSADLTDTISFDYDTVLTDEYISSESWPIGQKLTSDGRSTSMEFVNSSQTTKSNISYNELLIKKITFKDGYVLFNRNTARKDNLSNQVNYSLDEMLVYNTANQLIKKIQFNHNYFYTSNSSVGEAANNRLKLTGFIEYGSDINTKKEYKFDYDPTSLPWFGSYNMDYWGFYNGAQNQSLIPTTKVYGKELNNTYFVSGESAHNNFWIPYESWTIGNANREPSELFMKARILNKITYPTGGYTEFEYEPHKYLSDDYITRSVPQTISSTYGISQSVKNQASISFSCLPDPNVAAVNDPIIPANIRINFSASGMIFMEYGETQLVTLTNTTTNTIVKTWKHQGDLMLPLVVDEQILLNAGQNYSLKQEVYGNNLVFLNTSLNWTENTTQHPIKIGGGLRIKSLKSYSAASILEKEENYSYGTAENGLGVKLFDERYFYRNYEDIATSYYHPYSTSGGTCIYTGTFWQRTFLGISKYNSLNYNGSSILYSTVTKYEGTSSSNIGKTVYNYKILPNTTTVPDEFISSSNYGSIDNVWNQGELMDETSFKKEGIQYIPVEKKEYEYTKLNQATESGIMFKQSKQFVKLGDCFTNAEGPDIGNTKYGQGFFSMFVYPIETGVSKKTKETQIFYNQTNPANTVTSVTNYQYQNPANRYLTETSITNSDGNTNITRIKYPQDIADPVSTAMVSKNILTTPLEEKKFKSVGGTETLLSTMQTTYKQIGNLVVRDHIKASKGANTPETRILFNQYDLNANILEQQKTGDTRQSFIWGYNKTKPIAKIENIAYNSIPSSLITAAQTASDTGTEAALLSALASLRNDPALANAIVTTFTYKPLIGVSSVTDPKGYTTYYTYDSFNRLQFIKDKDLNVLQRYCYNYLGQQTDCNIGTATVTTFKNVVKSQTFTKQACAAGSIGSSIVYSVPAGIYSSTISQAAADALATNEITANGQNFANANGTCISSLAAPTGLVFTNATTSTINFSWTAVAGATSYKIYKAGVYVSTVSTTTGSLSGLIAGTGYSVQILAAIGSVESALSASVSMNTLPGVPTGLTFTSATTSSINFSWTAVAGATSYKIYKGGVYVSTVSTTTGSLSGLAVSTPYAVQVLATNASGDGALSSSVSMSTLPGVPTGLVLTSATSSTINFSWTAVTGATGYKIYKNGAYVSTVTTTAGSLSGLAASTPYAVQVLATNASGDGALCAAVNMSTTAALATDACNLVFTRLSGSCTLYKNNTWYLSRSTSGTSTGILTAGDTFYVEINDVIQHSRTLTITSSVRGVLANIYVEYSSNPSTPTITRSGTFTKVGSEIITIQCVTKIAD